MKTTDYWIKRAERVINAGDKKLDVMINELQEVYLDSLSAIQKEINSFYGQFAKDNKLDMVTVHKMLNPAELKSFHREMKKFYDKAKPELIGRKMSKEYRQILRKQYAKMHLSRLEQLKICIRNEIIQLGGIENNKFAEILTELYENTYSRTCYNIDKFKGYSIGFEKLNYVKVNKALEQNWVGDNYSGRIWKNKEKLINQLETTFLQGVVMGKNPKVIGEEMAGNMGASVKSCVRLARTEGGHIMGEATLDSYKSTEVKKYQYIATLDRRTSDICKDLDGKVFLVKDAVEGVNYPEMHPNCRSTTIPFFDDRDIMSFRASKEKGQYKLVPADMTYYEWERTVA